MTPEQFAHAAKSLKDNEIFQLATQTLQAEAKDALVSANPTDADEIRKWQAQVKAVSDLGDALENIILNGTTQTTKKVA